jgi:hypothetical protein
MLTTSAILELRPEACPDAGFERLDLGSGCDAFQEAYKFPLNQSERS